MKRFVLVPALLVVIAAGCASVDGDRPGATSAAPQAASTSAVPNTTTTTTPEQTTTTPPPGPFGGEVTIGIDLSIESLNPFAPNSFRERVVGNALWAMVYDIDPETWERIPDTVAEMPSRSGGIEVNQDGSMTVRYEIAAGAVWSDGVPISGQDLAFTAEAMREMALAGEGNVDPVMATVSATEAEGRVALITFAEPTLAFEDALWIVLPSHALDSVDLVNGTDGSDWPSGGPFVVDEFDRFSSVRLLRNDAYWKLDGEGRSLPYLDALTIAETTETGLQANEPASPIRAFVNREIDIAAGFWGEADLARVGAVEPEGAVLDKVPTPVIEHLTFNFSDARFEVNPLSVNDSEQFRQALATSIDRHQIIADTDIPWFSGTPGMLEPTTSGWSVYDTTEASVPDLPDGAASVLSTTGNGDYRIRIGDTLVSTFADVGVSYTPTYEDAQLFFDETIVEGAYDIGMWAWISDGGFASQLGLMQFLDPASSPPDGNFGNWGSGPSGNEATRRFSEIVAEASVTFDSVRFRELVAEAEQILVAELPLIPLFQRSSAIGVWADTVAGVVNNGSQAAFTWNVETWRRIDG